MAVPFPACRWLTPDESRLPGTPRARPACRLLRDRTCSTARAGPGGALAASARRARRMRGAPARRNGGNNRPSGWPTGGGRRRSCARSAGCSRKRGTARGAAPPVPQAAGDARPAGGGTKPPITPKQPTDESLRRPARQRDPSSGLHHARELRGGARLMGARTSRRTSTAPRQITPSANGKSSASASRVTSGSPSASARRCACSSSTGT